MFQFSAFVNCEGAMGGDKFALLEMPTTHKIIAVALEEEKNVILHGDEDLLSGVCCMICASRSCAGFSTSSVNTTTNDCLLYSKVEFARTNATDPPLEVKEKLYMR